MCCFILMYDYIMLPGIKQNLLDMMLSYNPLWLRIGLEVRPVYQSPALL